MSALDGGPCAAVRPPGVMALRNFAGPPTRLSSGLLKFISSGVSKGMLTGLLAVLPLVALAAGDPPPTLGISPTASPQIARIVEFAHDNDQLAFTPGASERWYSSGLFLRTAALADPSAPDARLMARWCAVVLACDADARIDRVWGLSQLIHTPAWTGTDQPQPRDWPYAASLYGSLSLVAHGAHTRQTLSLQLGVLGPAALGEQLQNAVHSLLNQPKALGFAWQVGPQPVLQAAWSRLVTHPLSSREVDLVTRTTAVIGLPLTQASAGALLRFADRPAGPSWPGEIQAPGTSTRSWYGWIGAEAFAVAHQAYIDGPVKSYESLVHHRNAVGHLIGGASVHLGARTWIDFGVEFRTLEFTAPPGSRSMTPQRIGTLVLRHGLL